MKKVSVLLALALAVSAAVTAAAGTITWGAATTVSADSDVLTNGSPVYAYQIGNSSASFPITVNGVDFAYGTEYGGGSDVSFSGFADGYKGPYFGYGAGLSSAYGELLHGSTWGANDWDTATITLMKLTTGQSYAVQVWVQDARDHGDYPRTELVGGAVTLNYNSTGGLGGLGQYTVGYFTATAETQAFTMQGTRRIPQLSALQLRALPPPPPLPPTAPSPADAAVDVPLASSLTWSAPGAAGYQVSLWTVGGATTTVEVASPTWTPSTLDAATEYAWQVVATNSAGSTTGAVWTFTTFTPFDPAAFAYKMKIFFNYTGGDVLTNFPALVRFNAAGSFYSGFASPSGYDLRFTTADGLRLNHEFDGTWNPAGESAVWVQVPQFTNNCTIWAYWGNPAATAQPAFTTNGAVWADGYMGVWHMNQTAVQDSTARGHNGSPAGNVSNAGGLIGGGNDFTPAAYIQVPASLDFTMGTDDFTMSAWVNFRGWNAGGWGAIFGTWGPGFILATYNGDVSFHGDSAVYWTTVYDSYAPVSLNNWSLVTVTRHGGSEWSCYIDGVDKRDRSASIAMNNSGTPLLFGCGGSGWTDGFWWNGMIDESRIERKWRSADWVKACHSNQVAGSTFVTYVRVGPPTVDITSPTNTAIVGTNLTIQATAMDDGTVTNVYFYDGATLLGNDAGAGPAYSNIWHGAPLGAHALKAVAWDNDGNASTSAVVNVTVVVNPATVAFTSPTDGTTVATPATITITAAAADVGGTVTNVEFYDGATLLGNDDTGPAYSWSVVGASAGAHALKAVAWDNDGMAATSAAVNVTVFVMPSIAWETPKNITDDSDVSTTGTLVRADSGASPACTVNGVNFTDTLTTQSDYVAGSWSSYSSGYRTWKSAVDSISEQYVHLLTYPPWKYATNPYNAGAPSGLSPSYTTLLNGFIQIGFNNSTILTLGGLTPGQEYLFQLWANDSSGYYGVPQSIYLDGVPVGQNGDGTLNAKGQYIIGRFTAAGTYQTLTITTPNFMHPDPAYWVMGWVSAYQLRALASPPPTVDITSPTNTATVAANFTIDATATDVGGTVTNVYFYDGATLLGNDATSPYNWNVTSALVGPHALTAVARDNDGNATTSAVVNVTVVVPTPPTVAITSPADGTRVYASFTIAATATDAGGTVTNVEFYYDGALVGNDTNSPYAWDVTGALVGPHALKAVAWDNDGMATTSAAVNVTVVPPIAIAWDAPKNISGDSDVVTNVGTLVRADSGASPACTVNGVVFNDTLTTFSDYTWPFSSYTTQPRTLSSAVDSITEAYPSLDAYGIGRYTANPWGVPPGGLSPDYTTLLSGCVLISFNEYTTMTLGGLTPGHFYLLQLWANDSSGNSSQQTIDGTVVMTPYSGAGAKGQYVIGRIYAGRNTQSFSITTPAWIFGIVSAYQVREIPPPPPTVAITSPTNSATVGANFTIQTTAADLAGTVTNVEFYDGVTRLGNDDTGPAYSWSVVGASEGAHALTAVAWDNDGLAATSAVVNVTAVVPTPPTVDITSPANNESVVPTFTIAATAADVGGTVTNVYFYDGVTLLGNDETGPAYSWHVVGASAGPHALKAVAWDNDGMATTSAVVNVTVIPQAVITWGPAQYITGDSDVFTRGGLVYAYHWKNASCPDATVNGVSFTGSTAISGGSDVSLAFAGAGYLNSVNPGDGLSAELNSALSGSVYDNNASGAANMQVTLHNLTVGQDYLVQVFVQNSWYGGANWWYTVLDGAVWLQWSSINDAGGVGQYSIGRFTATSSMQAFNVTAWDGSGRVWLPSALINALQLRVFPPTTVIMFR